MIASLVMDVNKTSHASVRICISIAFVFTARCMLIEAMINQQGESLPMFLASFSSHGPLPAKKDEYENIENIARFGLVFVYL